MPTITFVSTKSPEMGLDMPERCKTMTDVQLADIVGRMEIDD